MSEEYSVGYSEGYQAGWNEAMDATPPAPVKVWDAEGYDSLMQQMEMVKADNQRLIALVRAQQITIEKLEAQPTAEQSSVVQPAAPLAVEPDLIARLKHPEDHYEFSDPKKANAVLMSLCQEAADALAAPVQESARYHPRMKG